GRDFAPSGCDWLAWRRWSMRPAFKVDERRTTPWTSYPLARRSSARYEPSWPVIPVMSAVLAMPAEKSMGWAIAPDFSNIPRVLVIPRTAIESLAAMRHFSQNQG